MKLRPPFNSDVRSRSVTVRLSDNLITAIWKQRWQMQCVPGLSTPAESIVDSEILISFVYFLLILIFPQYRRVGIFMTKTQHSFSFWKGNQAFFFPVHWQKTQSPRVEEKFI